MFRDKVTLVHQEILATAAPVELEDLVELVNQVAAVVVLQATNDQVLMLLEDNLEIILVVLPMAPAALVNLQTQVNPELVEVPQVVAQEMLEIQVAQEMLVLQDNQVQL
jgi:hypothetical protein